MSGQDLSRKPRGRGLKFMAALVALIVVGLSLYASQRPQQTALQTGEDKALARANKAVAAAKAFLGTLDKTQRSKAEFEFNSSKKSAWSNLPVSFVPRNGMRMGDMTQAQRKAAFELLAATLSQVGYQKVIDIMDGDQQVAGGKGGKGGKDKGGKDKGGKGGDYGSDNYYLALFGTPSVSEPWMVQFGGHHLGLNVTIVAKNFVLTPTHTGAQPKEFTRDGKKVRPMGEEYDTAFKLIGALDDKQRKQAVVDQKFKDMIYGPGNKDGVKIAAPIGLKGSALTEAQQGLLLDVIKQWVGIVNDDDAATRMAEIKSKIADTYLAWSGPTTAGSAPYYRIQGPTVLIEYAPQGGTDHIHSVIRDPSNDYGQKLLKK